MQQELTMAASFVCLLSTGSHKRCRKNGSVLRRLGSRFQEPGAVFGSREPFSGAAPPGAVFRSHP